MAKEKFHRDQPHVNIGTIGHVDQTQASDPNSTVQYNESQLGFLRQRAARNGFLVVLLVLLIVLAVVLFGRQAAAPGNNPPFQPALITEIDFPAADITLERGFTSTDDLWDWAAQDCVPDYAPLVVTACLQTDTRFPIIIGSVYNPQSSSICQTPILAHDPDGDLVQAPPASQAEEHFFTIELIEGRVASALPQNSAGGEGGSDVAIEMIQLAVEQFDTSSDPGQVPFILVLYDTVFPGAARSGEIVAADFNFVVRMDSLPSNILSIHPQMDPASGEVIGPDLALIGNPDDPDSPLSLVDLSDPSLPEQGMLLALIKMVPAAQLLPPVIPPLCGQVSIPPLDETQEPAGEPPDSTEEPVDQPAAVCGDLVCDPNTENSDICPDDCQCVDDGLCAPGEGANCRDCGTSAGSCGAVCSESSQCAAGLSCAGGICWDAVVCGGADPGAGGGGGSGSGGGSDDCTIIRRTEDQQTRCITLYDSCGGTQVVCP